MNVLVLGAGAIGGYYGARLHEAGAQVTFLVRPARARHIEETGICVKSQLGDVRWAARTATRIDGHNTYDLVLLACKGFDLDSAIDAIAPAVTAGACVLPFLNGMGAYKRLDGAFGKARILGGAAYIAVELLSQGHVMHYGVSDKVVIGARSRETLDLASRVHVALAKSGGQRLLSHHIDEVLWNKWVMIAAGAAVTCLSRGTIAEVLATPGGAQFVRRAINECCAGVAAAEMPLAQSERQAIEERLLDGSSNWASSMKRDMDRGISRIESEAILGDLVRIGKVHAIDQPILLAALTHLQVYETQRS